VHPLHSFWLKLNRANAHLQTLQLEIETWLAQKPYAVFGKHEPGSPDQYVFRVRFFAPVPPEWGILIGEFAHNARSALDHLAWQIVSSGSASPGRGTQFPIVLLEEDWETEAARRLPGAQPRHLELIEERQPYKRTDLSKQQRMARVAEQFKAAGHPLAILAALNNEDKHRVLATTPAALRSIGYDVIAAHDVSAIDLDNSQVSFEALKDDSEMLRVPITVSGPNPEVKLKRSETVEIAVRYRVEFPREGGYSETSGYVADTLGDILKEEWDIFEVFVNEFR
jgi:hypothetical protein